MTPEERLLKAIFGERDENGNRVDSDYQLIDDDGIQYVAQGWQEMEEQAEAFKDCLIAHACFYADVVKETTGERPSQIAMEKFIADLILEVE